MYPQPVDRSDDLPDGGPHAAALPAAARLLRRDFETHLGNLNPSPNTHEARFIDSWSDTLSAPRWEKWLLSWMRGLAAYGTPLSFVDGVTTHVENFRESGMTWPLFFRRGGNYEERRKLIAAQQIYSGMIPRDELPYRFDACCKLCENIHQGEDAKRFPGEAADNIMIDLGARVIAPVRYPSLPLAMLWLPKDHDDMSSRVPRTEVPLDDGKVAAEYRRAPGKTRDALLNAAELDALFYFSHAIGLVALRNHQVSGKSIPFHDHWQLYPLEHYPEHWFSNFAGEFPDGDVREMRARGTPYDVLVLRDSSLAALALRTAEIGNALERGNVAYAPYFVPGERSSLVILAPLNESAGDRFIQIGGSVQAHERNTPEALERFERFVPKRGDFPWENYRA